MNSQDEFKELLDRFGPDGLKHLGDLEHKMDLMLHRLAVVTTIAANLHTFDPEAGSDFLKQFDPLFKNLNDEIQKDAEKFTRDHGEI